MAAAATTSTADTTSSAPLIQKIKDFPTKFVTVFSDRAEVTRRIETSIGAGETTLVLGNLSKRCDKSTIRVAGGKGQCTVFEVTTAERFADQASDSEKRTQLRQDRLALVKKLEDISNEEARVKKEQAFVESWSSRVKDPISPTGQGANVGGLPFTPEILERADAFLGFYAKRLAAIDTRLADIRTRREDVNEKIRAIDLELPSAANPNEPVHDVHILLSATAPTPVALDISYVITGARWFASYDARVSSDSDKLDMTYYGTVHNDTNEDWTDAEVSLSTAQPSIGGQPPALTTKHIHLDSHRSSGFRGGLARAPSASFGSFARSGSVRYEEQMSLASVATTQVKTSTTYSHFVIPRRATIPSDNKSHKLTIHLFQLVPIFTYAVQPSSSAHAYLRAKVVNTTNDFPFLAGAMNVFMDSNFVAKSNISTVSPGEAFQLFLGIDDGIKVDVKPPQQLKSQTGIFSRSNTMTVTHKTTITNNKKKPIHVHIADRPPKSNQGQITIALLKPNLQQPEASDGHVKYGKDNETLKWKHQLAPGKSIPIEMQFKVDWPGNQQINI